jgi:hypothetical protein
MSKTNHKPLPVADALKPAPQAIQAPPADGLMDTASAAAHVALKPLTLVDFRTRGVGPAWYKLGGACRYLRSDLDAWVQSCRKGA